MDAVDSIAKTFAQFYISIFEPVESDGVNGNCNILIEKCCFLKPNLIAEIFFLHYN